jgi:hypothetical protein
MCKTGSNVPVGTFLGRVALEDFSISSHVLIENESVAWVKTTGSFNNRLKTMAMFQLEHCSKIRKTSTKES